MSGGRFDYSQYKIEDIINEIEREIEQAEAPKPPKKEFHAVYIYDTDDYMRISHNYNNYDEAFSDYCKRTECKLINEDVKSGGKRVSVFQLENGSQIEIREQKWIDFEDQNYYVEYDKETIQELKNGLNILRKAFIYAQRIDYLLSGDDGEESFKKRLKNDLEALSYDLAQC